ncbi:MAG: thioesterase, partial [Alphaproteobacteria bacterium]|nr:thioesterase [Alphaproteobacteria bacterium]
RSDFMLLLGLDHRAAFEAGQGYFAVAEASIKYLRPAKLDDALVIISQFTELRTVSWCVHQRVMCDGQELAYVDILAAFLDMHGRPTRQPAGWTESYKTILKEAP